MIPPASITPLAGAIGPGQRYVPGSSAVVCSKLSRWTGVPFAAAVYYSRSYVTGWGSTPFPCPTREGWRGVPRIVCAFSENWVSVVRRSRNLKGAIKHKEPED
jgi:hypothetical protein